MASKTVQIVQNSAEDNNLRKIGTDPNYKYQWRSTTFASLLLLAHIFSIYGVYSIIFKAKILTTLWGNYFFINFLLH